MMRAITRVVRGEGVASAMRRATERIGETLRENALHARGFVTSSEGAEILNVSSWPIGTRFGGVQVQLAARLKIERTMRNVALLHPRGLDLAAPRAHSRASRTIRDALAFTGAKAVHLEGTDGAPLDELLQLEVPLVVTLMDFSLFCRRPHLVELPFERFCDYSRDLDRCARCLNRPANEQATYRAKRRELLQQAVHVIAPSQFVLDKHRELFDLPLQNASIIAPASSSTKQSSNPGRAIAYIGAVKRHKGAHLLPQLIRDEDEWHIFGGGDDDLLRALRDKPNVTVHGYYREGELPSLLAQHRIGLAVVPSIWPETFAIVISEAWLANTLIAAFDLGAQAERIRAHGGGFLTSLESGADGLANVIAEWKTGRRSAHVPLVVPTALDAAHAHVELYRSLHFIA